MSAEFEGFPKIPRLKRECVITEKIDGTNAQVYIEELDEDNPGALAVCEGTPYVIRAGSKNRWLVPGNDNFGFALWVYDNRDELVKLGPGRHYGEWYGAGIQRRYGLPNKRFALFNTGRWAANNACVLDDQVRAPECCEVVPVLARGGMELVEPTLEKLRSFGSVAVPGWDNPEGVVVYHTASRQLFKVLLQNDEAPKGAR